MALADKLKAIDSVVNPKKCVYQKMIDEMPQADREALESAWENEVSAKTILRALRSENYKTSNEAIHSHRTGTCKCVKNE